MKKERPIRSVPTAENVIPSGQRQSVFHRLNKANDDEIHFGIPVIDLSIFLVAIGVIIKTVKIFSGVLK